MQRISLEIGTVWGSSVNEESVVEIIYPEVQVVSSQSPSGDVL